MTLAFDAPVDEESTPDKRKLVAIGAAAAVVLAGGGWFFLHSSGSDGPALGLPSSGLPKPAAVRPAVKSAVKAKPAAKTVKPTTVLPVASTAKLGRDPFKALYVVPAAAATTTAPTTTTPTTTTGAAATTTAPYVLQLVSISGPANSDKVFTFKYGSVSKTVVAAQKFGKIGELVTLNYIKNSKNVPIAALIQVGDDDPVIIKIGEKLTVQ